MPTSIERPVSPTITGSPSAKTVAIVPVRSAAKSAIHSHTWLRDHRGADSALRPARLPKEPFRCSRSMRDFPRRYRVCARLARLMSGSRSRYPSRIAPGTAEDRFDYQVNLIDLSRVHDGSGADGLHAPRPTKVSRFPLRRVAQSS